MTRHSQVPASELAASDQAALPRCNRWSRSKVGGVHSPVIAVDANTPDQPPPPPTPSETSVAGRRPRRASCPSYILQHYHSTGCCGGAFSWRAALLNPEKELFLCELPREYRKTTVEDIQLSLDDKRRGGGPRVGPFQECIPGDSWYALPKYDFTTRNRSSAFNERMHVEWENHVDHILANSGELPVASVVAKAGFRSCSPCCRDMLALAGPTGKTFIMVDLADDDQRGTFHFVTGSRYLPVPKEACSRDEIAALKKVVTDAQNSRYTSSDAIFEAVSGLGVPVDETAQAMYLQDRALLPAGSASGLCGPGLLEVLHAEHFARLLAEYGASILRDASRPREQHEAVRKCRALAKDRLARAWLPHLQGAKVDLEAYAAAAVTPLLPEEPNAYSRLRNSANARRSKKAEVVETRTVAATPTNSARMSGERRWSVDRAKSGRCIAKYALVAETEKAHQSNVFDDDGAASIAAASTAVPDDSASVRLGDEEPWMDIEEDFEEQPETKV
mmetsp:Transcript_34199/g.60495  ORF Transcript_34199/g.60495 Transcript_34199/m.60495 type:complete len:504 (-) Transcript_34199:140-1651(-)